MRYKVIISYDGGSYSGFQVQPNAHTIQSEIEKTLAQVLGVPITIVASGRTDAGVSAIEQVCHFDVDNPLDTRRAIGYANSLLPRDIRIHQIEEVFSDFHARYSAVAKTYLYYFYCGTAEIPVLDKVATFEQGSLDIDSMNSACQYFMGEHDFSAFCASGSQVESKVRTITDIRIDKIDNLYRLEITGNGFLYNMVRIIMGTLFDVGRGKISPDSITDIINSGDRARAGKTASAKGLYLKKVLY